MRARTGGGCVHKIDFDVKRRRDGSLEVRHKWIHDVGQPHETVVQQEFRRYESADDLAREVTYFLNIQDNYGPEAETALRKGLLKMTPRELKLLSYVVIDLWQDSTIEQRRRKISNQRRFRSLYRALHDAIRLVWRKNPRLTYGEIMAALEREHAFFQQAIENQLDLVDVWKIGKRRRGVKVAD